MPTIQEIDAFVTQRVAEVVPEIRPEYSFCSGHMKGLEDWSCPRCIVPLRRPIQIAGILRLLGVTYISLSRDSIDSLTIMTTNQHSSVYGKHIDWNLSLDWSGQDDPTKLAIYNLLK